MLLPAMLWYGWMGVEYIHGRRTIHRAVLVFVFACSLHFAMLIALPSLLFLPFIRKQVRDLNTIAAILLLLIPLVVIRNYPQVLGYKAAGLSPAWTVLPWFPYEGMYRHYAFFEWGHWLDWGYAWVRRSWIVWPIVLIGISTQGIRGLSRADRMFLMVYTLGFTFWTTFWHPDLGIETDWDLFAIETAPALLLAISYLPGIARVHF